MHSLFRINVYNTQKKCEIAINNNKNHKKMFVFESSFEIFVNILTKIKTVFVFGMTLESKTMKILFFFALIKGKIF